MSIQCSLSVTEDVVNDISYAYVSNAIDDVTVTASDNNMVVVDMGDNILSPNSNSTSNHTLFVNQAVQGFFWCLHPQLHK